MFQCPAIMQKCLGYWPSEVMFEKMLTRLEKKYYNSSTLKPMCSNCANVFGLPIVVIPNANIEYS